MSSFFGIGKNKEKRNTFIQMLITLSYILKTYSWIILLRCPKQSKPTNQHSHLFINRTCQLGVLGLSCIMLQQHSMIESELLWKKGTPKIISKSISRMPMECLMQQKNLKSYIFFFFLGFIGRLGSFAFLDTPWAS